MVDTGFTEYISIPSNFAQQLGIKVVDNQTVYLADGSAEVFAVGTVTLKLSNNLNIEFSCEAFISDDDEVLIGYKLLELICQKLNAEMVFNFDTQELRFDSYEK